MFINRLIILFDGIPFIHSNDNTLAFFMGDSCNFGILLCHTLRGINQDHDHIGTLYRSNRTDYAVTLNIFFYLSFSAQAGSIYEDIVSSLPGNLRVHRIPGCSGNIRNNYPVFAQKLIDQ